MTMFLFDLSFALLFAFVFAALLAAVFGWRHPARRDEDTAWGAAIFLFMLLFFVIWAGGVWIGPFGPMLWSGFWLPFLLVGAVISLVVLAVADGRPRERRTPGPLPGDDPAQAPRRAAIYGLAFWLLLLVLLAILVFGYLD
jgi:hypothetical protein